MGDLKRFMPPISAGSGGSRLPWLTTLSDTCPHALYLRFAQDVTRLMETTNICMVLERQAMIDCLAARPGGEEVPGVESLARDVDAGNKDYLREPHVSTPFEKPYGPTIANRIPRR